MRVVIDRIEDSVASVELENGKIINVPMELFEGFKEGDVLCITLNKDETEKIKNEVSIDLKSLFED